MSGDWGTTLWGTVLRARDRNSDEGRRALEDLAARYWKPVYVHIRRRHPGEETAKDLTQAFFAYLLDKELLSRVDPEKGAFRGYLRAILQRFLADQRDAAQAAKRGGGVGRVPLDFAEAETDFLSGPGDAEPPDRAFDRAWAEETLSRVLERFRAECEKEGRLTWFEVLRRRFGFLGGVAEHAAIAKDLGISETDVMNHLARGRARFRELMLEELRQGVSSDRGLEEEIRLFREIF